MPFDVGVVQSNTFETLRSASLPKFTRRKNNPTHSILLSLYAFSVAYFSSHRRVEAKLALKLLVNHKS